MNLQTMVMEGMYWYGGDEMVEVLKREEMSDPWKCDYLAGS